MRLCNMPLSPLTRPCTIALVATHFEWTFARTVALSLSARLAPQNRRRRSISIPNPLSMTHGGHAIPLPSGKDRSKRFAAYAGPAQRCWHSWSVFRHRRRRFASKPFLSGIGRVSWSASKALQGQFALPIEDVSFVDGVLTFALPAAPAKTLTRTDQIVWQVVDELGGVPQHGKKRAFWERVRQELTKRGIRYEGWQGPRPKYFRILKRLDPTSREIS